MNSKQTRAFFKLPSAYTIVANVTYSPAMGHWTSVAKLSSTTPGHAPFYVKAEVAGDPVQIDAAEFADHLVASVGRTPVPRTPPVTDTTQLELVNLALGWAAGNLAEIKSVVVTEHPNGTGTAVIMVHTGAELLRLEAFTDFEDLDSEWGLTKAPGF